MISASPSALSLILMCLKKSQPQRPTFATEMPFFPASAGASPYGFDSWSAETALKLFKGKQIWKSLVVWVLGSVCGHTPNVPLVGGIGHILELGWGVLLTDVKAEFVKGPQDGLT